jgi:hypothetical protein
MNNNPTVDSRLSIIGPVSARQEGECMACSPESKVAVERHDDRVWKVNVGTLQVRLCHRHRIRLATLLSKD